MAFDHFNLIDPPLFTPRPLHTQAQARPKAAYGAIIRASDRADAGPFWMAAPACNIDSAAGHGRGRRVLENVKREGPAACCKPFS